MVPLSLLALKLEEKSIPEPNSGCLLWLGRSTNKFGHGEFNAGCERWLAHRVAWIVAYGPIPTGLCVLHKCDVPACINPNHLFLGTRADNCRDRARKGRGISAGRLARISLRSKLAGNPAEDCTDRFKGLALRHEHMMEQPNGTITEVRHYQKDRRTKRV